MEKSKIQNTPNKTTIDMLGLSYCGFAYISINFFLQIQDSYATRLKKSMIARLKAQGFFKAHSKISNVFLNVQPWTLAIKRLLNKPYENEVTLTRLKTTFKMLPAS